MREVRAFIPTNGMDLKVLTDKVFEMYPNATNIKVKHATMVITFRNEGMKEVGILIQHPEGDFQFWPICSQDLV